MARNRFGIPVIGNVVDTVFTPIVETVTGGGGGGSTVVGGAGGAAGGAGAAAATGGNPAQGAVTGAGEGANGATGGGSVTEGITQGAATGGQTVVRENVQNTKPAKHDIDNPPNTTMIAPNRVEIPGANFSYYNAIGRSPYNIVDPQKFAQKYGTFNRQQIIQNYNIANKMALKQLDTELQGLSNFVPAASAIKRSETSADNQFNQAQRTAQVNAALPNAQRQLNEQAARAESFASGRMPSEIEDRALELTARSTAADNAALAGFGAGSSVARKASDLMSVQQRLQLSQYGDQLLNSNISNQANLFLAPTQYSNAGAEVRVMPTLSGSQLAGQLGSEINSSTMLPTAAALQASIGQNQFDTQLSQRVAEFNAANEMATSQFNTNAANQFAMAGFQYNVGYEGAVAGAANATTMNNIGIWEQQQAYYTMQAYQHQAAQAGMMQSLGSLAGAAIGGFATDGSMAGISMGAQLGGQMGNLLSGGSPNGAPSMGGGSYGGSSGTGKNQNTEPLNTNYDNAVGSLFPASTQPTPTNISGQGVTTSAPSPTPVISKPEQTTNPQLMQFSQATGVPMSFAPIDNQATTQRILSAGTGVMLASGIGYAGGNGMQPIGESASGPMFGSTARLSDASLSSGPSAVGTTASVLSALGVLNSSGNASVPDTDNFKVLKDIAAASSNPDLIAHLDSLAANGDIKGFTNNIMEATGKGTLESAKGNDVDSKSNAFAAYKLSEAWPSMSPGMKSSAIANLGLLNMKDSSGTKFADKVIPSTLGSPNGEVTVGKAIEWVGKGVNAASLTSNWDEINDVAHLALGAVGADSIAEYARDLGILGSGSDGKAVPTSAEELAKLGWHAAPEQGVGAVQASLDSSIPKNYVKVYQTDKYQIAIPSAMSPTATGVQPSNLTNSAAGIRGMSDSAYVLSQKWPGAGKIPANKGTVGGSATVAAYKLLAKTNPNIAASITASALVDPSEKVNYKDDLSYTTYLGKKSLSVLVSGDKNAKASNIEGKIPEGPLTTENFTKSMKELRTQYAKNGIKSKADAYALANKAYAEGRIKAHNLTSMHRIFSMVFDDDGLVQAKKLTSGKEKGIELAFSKGKLATGSSKDGSEAEEKSFRGWYSRMAAANKLSADPYNPRHQYDYKGYWRKYVKGKPEMKDHFGIPQADHSGQRRFTDEFKAKGYKPQNEGLSASSLAAPSATPAMDEETPSATATVTPETSPTQTGTPLPAPKPMFPKAPARRAKEEFKPKYKPVPMLTKEEMQSLNADYYSRRGA